MINHAAIMLHAIGNHQIGDLQCGVVMPNLIKRILAELNGRPFTFNNHYRLNSSIIDDDICPVVTILYRDRYLNAYQSGWNIQIPDEILDKVLAYPFLGSQRHKAFPNRVQNYSAPGLITYLIVIRWQV